MDNVARVLRNKSVSQSPLIMTSLDPQETQMVTPASMIPSRPIHTAHVLDQFESLNINSLGPPNSKSLHLLDDSERLLITSEEQFTKLLNIEPNHKVKVVSIFGNTGEGKSYTLNHVFFDGEEVFATSPRQDSCTMGVWAMYNRELKVICLDTEGLLGVSKKENQRTRLLLKILAVSDVVIYLTKADRLQRDMYSFLGGASKAYKEHFSPAVTQLLQKNGVENVSEFWGPALIIFHETRHTHTLDRDIGLTQCVEDLLRENFTDLEQSCNGFSSLKYVGQQNTTGITSFKEVKEALLFELDSTRVRSARDAKYIFLTLKGLNEKFQCLITDNTHELYLPAFFTCQEKCLSCGASCILSMGHKDDNEPHFTNHQCKHQHQFQNFVYLCRACHKNGIRQVVEAKYQQSNEAFWTNILSSIWSGYIIECPRCGRIFQSREHWYGNKDPKDCAVLMEYVHVWPGDKCQFQDTSLLGSGNSAQKVLDGVTCISNAVASVGSQPTKMISDWMTDQIAPSYWRPNSEISECFKCKTPFASKAVKHHCRSCGEGFCEQCSSRTQPVPSRGWHEPARVCDLCFKEEPPSLSSAADPTEVRARRYGETIISSMSMVKSVFDIPKDFIKDSVRPTYWMPDSECTHCAVCRKPFGAMLHLHHCRDCGKGVCDKCSNSRKPVPLRGWDSPVRVCDNCLS